MSSIPGSAAWQCLFRPLFPCAHLTHRYAERTTRVSSLAGSSLARLAVGGFVVTHENAGVLSKCWEWAGAKAPLSIGVNPRVYSLLLVSIWVVWGVSMSPGVW